jgi:hypothetical protein
MKVVETVLSFESHCRNASPLAAEAMRQALEQQQDK